MIEELVIAINLLDSALDRYLKVCLAIQQYIKTNSFDVVLSNLSPHVASEANSMVTSLELKLQKAKLAMCWARNYSPAFVPIHILPRELLERIFMLISRSQYDYGISRLELKSRPEAVSHVCSLWREVALNLPTFWSAIRLPLTGERVNFGRVATFVERARSLPLDLQVHDQNSSRLFPLINTLELSALIGTISPHLRSLHVETGRRIDLRSSSALVTYLTGCQHGSLKTLITSVDKSLLNMPNTYRFFDISTRLPHYLDGHYNINVIRAGMSDLSMASIVTLRLKGLYPFWTSRVYHGLVELCLGSTVTPVLISENHLLGILRASPALRILEFDLLIVEPTHAHILPIRLDHLESLSVGRIACEKIGTLFRWLSPGSNPLQLSFHDHAIRPRLPISPMTDIDEVASFFSRSNVREVYMKNLAFSSVTNLLDVCPTLRVLALDGCDLFGSSERATCPIWHPRLESLFVLRCLTSQQPTFSNLAVSPDLREVLFWECGYGGGKGWGRTVKLHSDNLHGMVGVCPDVRVIDYNPIQEWATFHE